VGAGRYGAQELPASEAPRTGPHVTFAPAAGARVAVGELVVAGDHVTFRDMRVGGWTATEQASDVTFEDLEVRGGIFVTGARRIRMHGGSVGPGVDYSSEIKAAVEGGRAPSDILIDGVRFHDWTRSDPEAHVDCLHVMAAEGLTVRNSEFSNCEAFAVLLSGYGGASTPTRIRIEHNRFSCCRSGFYALALGDGQQWRDVQILENVSNESFTLGIDTTDADAGVVFARNVLPQVNPLLCDLPGVRWQENVVASGKPCGTDDVVAPDRFADALAAAGGRRPDVK
jgi:hypothetical protein